MLTVMIGQMLQHRAPTLWELGTPAFGVTSSSHSAPNSWDVNLNSAYTGNANAILLSPFFDFTPVQNVELSFGLIILRKVFGMVHVCNIH
jgi:hypothetical protein